MERAVGAKHTLREGFAYGQTTPETNANINHRNGKALTPVQYWQEYRDASEETQFLEPSTVKGQVTTEI